MSSDTIEKSSIRDIVKVEPLNEYHISVVFDDGISKKIDLKPYINAGISSELKDLNYFKRVYLDNGSVTWPNGFDFCPVFLRK